jgi:hypothetical protein
MNEWYFNNFFFPYVSTPIHLSNFLKVWPPAGPPEVLKKGYFNHFFFPEVLNGNKQTGVDCG